MTRATYTVPTSNNFAGLDSDASSDEEGPRVASPQSPPQGALNVSRERLSSPIAGNASTQKAAEFGGDRMSPTEGGFKPRGRGGMGRNRGGQMDRFAGDGAGQDRPFGGEPSRPGGSFGRWERQQSDEDARGGEGHDRARQQNVRGDVRGGGGGRGAQTGTTRHRDKDRHVSGTNRGRGLKKGGGGAHNWGNREQDCGGESVPENAAFEEFGAAVVTTEQGETPIEAAGRTGETEQSVDKEVKAREQELIDLEEYQRQQAERRAKLPALPSSNISTANQRAELEKDGYTLHVKQHDPTGKKGAPSVSLTSPATTLFGERQTKTKESQLQQDLLGERRPRGGRRGPSRPGGDRQEKPEETRDFAPSRLHLADEASFPRLGDDHAAADGTF